MTALKYLKHDRLKAIRKLPKISKDEFTSILVHYFPDVLDEFARQTQCFRGLLKPYSLTGSITYEDSLAQNSSYGTRLSSKKDLVADLVTPRGPKYQVNYDSYGLNNSPQSSIQSTLAPPIFSSLSPPPLVTREDVEEEEKKRTDDMANTIAAVQAKNREEELQRPPTSEPIKYNTSERIQALYLDKWYRAKISKVNRPPEPEQRDGESKLKFETRLQKHAEEDALGVGYSYDVLFDDGDFEKAMPPRKIRKDPLGGSDEGN